METFFISSENDFKRWIKEAIKESFTRDSKQEKASISETKQPLLNRKEIASILNISLVTLTEWMKKGLPYHKPNRRVYFLKDEVIDYIKSQKNHSSGW